MRGWPAHGFDGSLIPGSVTESVVFTETPNRIGCRWLTGSIPSPIAPRVEMLFFYNDSDQRKNGRLRNGWRASSWELSGGNFTAFAPVPRVRLVAEMILNQTGRTWRYRVTRLVLTRTGGVCANAIDQTF